MDDEEVALLVVLNARYFLAARLLSSGQLPIFLHHLLRQKQGQHCGGQKRYAGNTSHNIVMKETTIF